MQLIHVNYLPRQSDAHINLEEEEEEEEFQTVSLDDEQWTTKDIPDRPLCVHEHSLPHGLCPYPHPYVNYQTSLTKPPWI